MMADKAGAERIESHFTNEGSLQRAMRERGFMTTGPDLGKAAAGGDAKPGGELA